jgi:hypothetical protein
VTRRMALRATMLAAALAAVLEPPVRTVDVTPRPVARPPASFYRTSRHRTGEHPINQRKARKQERQNRKSGKGHRG